MIDNIDTTIPILLIDDKFSRKIITDNNVLKRTIPILFIPKTKALFKLKDLIAASKK
jgi:hypothetical protein